jgi:hypothetical protein
MSLQKSTEKIYKGVCIWGLTSFCMPAYESHGIFMPAYESPKNIEGPRFTKPTSFCMPAKEKKYRAISEI